MTFSFKYKPVKLKSGIIHRPIIPLAFREKQSLSVFAMLDSGSDLTVIPLEVAEELGLELKDENEISGISKKPVKAKESSVVIEFGKGHEIYSFRVPVLVPIEAEDMPIIIGREGFFNQFKIIFNEQRKEIEFKKIPAQRE